MRAAALTDIGLVRTRNEDAFWCDLDRGIFIIVDGLGGHKAGNVAAAIAVEVASAELTIAVDMGLTGVKLAEAMHEAFQVTSQEIFERSQQSKDLNGMACSMIAAVLEAGSCVVAHAGDTRAYLLIDNSLSQVTVDDTPVAALVKRGYLLPEKARSHTMKNFLVKSVGNKPTVEANVSKFPVRSKERLLLCSDGLWGMVEHETMVQILREQSDPEKACRELVNAAREKGGRDNITVIVVEVAGGSESVAESARMAKMPKPKIERIKGSQS